MSLPDAPAEQHPLTAFDWAVYADATFAGLSVLIIIPVVDWFFEEQFRRRMPGAIAKRRGRRLSPEIIKVLNRQESRGCVATCLLLPIKGIFELVKRISRKILYVFTIKEAVDSLSYYWQRAFLLDYSLSRGHLDTVTSAHRARLAMKSVLEAAGTPLTMIAKQVISMTARPLLLLRRVRQDQEDTVIEQQKSEMAKHWQEFASHFRDLAARYDQVYGEKPEPAANPET